MLRKLSVLLLLAFMGTEISSAQTKTRPVKSGEWSGETARVTVEKTSVQLDFGCGSGTINSALRIDKNGHFRVKGTYLVSTGVAPPPGEEPQVQNVFYVGTVKGKKMTFSIDFPNSERPSPSYELIEGKAAKDLPRCA